MITSCTWTLTTWQCWSVLHFFYTINKHYVWLLLLIPSKWGTFVRKFNLNREVWFKSKKSDLNKKIRFFDFYFKNRDLYQPWLGGTVGWSWLWVVGIEPERLQVSYYKLYNRCVREIRRENSCTAQTVNRSKFNENTQNMHAKQSVLNDIWQNTILLAAQTGALASSFSNMPALWTLLVAVGRGVNRGQTFLKGAVASLAPLRTTPGYDAQLWKTKLCDTYVCSIEATDLLHALMNDGVASSLTNDEIGPLDKNNWHKERRVTCVFKHFALWICLQTDTHPHHSPLNVRWAVIHDFHKCFWQRWYWRPVSSIVSFALQSAINVFHVYWKFIIQRPIPCSLNPRWRRY